MLLTAFNFDVTLLKSPAIEAGSNRELADIEIAEGDSRLCDGGFQECTGLEIEMDVAEYLEGGRKDGVIQRVGRAKYGALVLKRGMLFGEHEEVSREIWDWLQGIVTGRRPTLRYDGVIRVRRRQPGKESPVIATWVFERGLPAKVVGPQLNAESGKLAIEELHIAHEGLRLEAN
jgi:phage tail-like protein